VLWDLEFYYCVSPFAENTTLEIGHSFSNISLDSLSNILLPFLVSVATGTRMSPHTFWMFLHDQWATVSHSDYYLDPPKEWTILAISTTEM